ncbi:putative aspartic-type endopeptidase OPSB [Trichoderma lentiforme]|uniref:Aspartic-type endopeptidase OPSB n=1 Tax=Trichoderma lentiforme TaxID=1567552 RepID=A0A9P4X2G0_9HYPO|nr:putative aspartic-type endopeptidase OPSB [Trichoderma lentiforme]
MAISQFLVLSLAVLAQARPKHAFEPEDVGNTITLPVPPASHLTTRGIDVKAEEEDKPFHILPFPYPSKRDVESREEEDKPWHILPYPNPSKRKILEDDDGADGRITLPVPQRRSEDDEDKPFHILPFNEKRKLPVEEIPSGTITLPIIHAHRGTLDKRAVEVQVENRSDVSYYAQLNIGTPPQTVYAQIDTGSFELWVNPDCSNVQTSDQRFCRAIGFYDPKSSSTSFVTGSAAQLRYGIGSANVSYVQDSIALPGSATMKDVQFGVADASVDEFSGILGIGAGEGVNTLYPNFIDELAKQGVTKTKAFSLALGSKTEEEGVIIFGGVDTGKFSGKLAHLPIVPADDSPDGVARYWVDMNSISLSPPTGKSTTFANTKMTVFLDSGSTLTLLPQSLVNEIADSLGSTGTDDSGFAIVDCGLINEPGTIDFEFDGVTIKVPYSEMIRSVSSLPPHCYLGMMGSTQFALLGDTFLRSAYAVFDLTGSMVHLAPYVNCGTSVKTITSTSSLQDLEGTCNTNGSEEPSSPSQSSSSSTPSKTSSKAASSTTAPASSTVQPPSSTTASPTGARSTEAASTTAANTAKSSATNGADAESAQSGDKNGVGKMGVHGFAISMVFAAMGVLLI